MQSVPITTKVVSSNPIHGEVYSVQLEVGEGFVAGLLFSQSSVVSSISKTDHHDITEILLKVVLNTINHEPKPSINQSKGDNKTVLFPRKKTPTFNIIIHVYDYYYSLFNAIFGNISALQLSWRKILTKHMNQGNCFIISLSQLGNGR